MYPYREGGTYVFRYRWFGFFVARVLSTDTLTFRVTPVVGFTKSDKGLKLNSDCVAVLAYSKVLYSAEVKPNTIYQKT